MKIHKIWRVENHINIHNGNRHQKKKFHNPLAIFIRYQAQITILLSFHY